MFPPRSPQAHPLERPLEFGDPNCPSSRKLQTTFPSHNTHHAQLETPRTAHWSPPSRTHNCLSVPLSTKYTLRIRNLCAQHDTIAESKKCHIVTCVCVNAIRTILQFTLVTHGHLFRIRLGATKGTNIRIITHNILIIIVLLCRCGPYMCRYMFPRTIWRVPYLSSNQKLLQKQEYTHVLMQLRTGSPPYVPYNAPVPHACKQVLNACPIETMNTIVLLLPLGQRLSTDKWPRYVTPAFSGNPKQRGTKSEVKTYARGHHDAPSIKVWI